MTNCQYIEFLKQIKSMNMKKLICILFFFSSLGLIAQEEENRKNSANYEFGQGLTFDLNDGDYQFYLGGFIQPSINIEKFDDAKIQNEFNVRRAFFMLGGNIFNQKISFLVQTDFGSRNPLLDAWIAYHPFKWATISAGQKQNFVNNREMLYREDRLQFTDRSLSSQTFSRTGREFGLFIETRFGKKFGIAPKASLTSGDGQNSFGADSRDVDLGGVKIGGRLDLYPLGFFTEGNDLYTADLAHEKKLKMLVGGALSKNQGASNAVGEGHGDFLTYNIDGENNLPNYTQLYADILMKFKGFSLLLEYSNASASGLDIVFLDQDAQIVLAPTQISEFLILGNSYTAQLGYVTKSGFSFDFRYENLQPEFKNNNNSLLKELNSFTLGIGKYFNGNNLKLQTAVTRTQISKENNITSGDLLFQVTF